MISFISIGIEGIQADNLYMILNCLNVFPSKNTMQVLVTVCAEIFAVLNFHSCVTLRIFADFIFEVVGQIKFIIFQFKMFELESFIRGFMFNMYRGRLTKERYFIALGNR